MFENLLHQQQVKQRLLRDFETGDLPRSMLFVGDSYSGKLSAALELARGLSCSKDTAQWSCNCTQCRQHRLLDSPYTLMLGRRYFLEEIRSCGAMLAQSPETPLYYLFYRAVKKLIRRFDPLLWEDDEKKLTKAAGLIEKLESQLEVAHPELAAPKLPDFDKIYSLVEDVEKLLPADGISIHMIRRANYWSHTADPGVRKTVIIEGAHEMNEGARNAFLKTLEEPPESVYFILITNRPGAIIPTIRSRLRSYTFSSRGRDQQRDILQRIFRCANSDSYGSIGSFFLDSGPGGLDERRQEMKLMFELLSSGSIDARDKLVSILGSDRRELSRLIGLCLEELQSRAHELPASAELHKKLEEIHYRSQVYNIPVASALEFGYI